MTLRADFQRALAREIARPRATPRAGSIEAELARLPAPVQRYLRASGAVALPRPSRFEARWHGRIRQSASSAWMPFRATQTNFLDAPRARLFFMDATMKGLPTQVFHAYVDERATMDVRLFGMLSVAHEEGATMTESETVTLLNDVCLFAPGALVDEGIAWQPIDERRARATITNAGFTVSAELVFGDDGMLVDFVSDDRSQSQGKDGFRKLRWSTPMRSPRALGPLRLASAGEARWHPPEGAFAYIELELDALELVPAQ